MVHQVLAPSVENGRDTQFGLETFLAKLQERGAGSLEEQSVERGWILQSQWAQNCRKGEDPMEVAHGQHSPTLLS
jgi:hypothetical protein